MIKKIIAAGMVLLAGFLSTGCPTEADSRSTKEITVTGIPASVTLIIVEAGGSEGAAVLGGNLNTDPNGYKIEWTAIENGEASVDLYSEPEMTAYLLAARKGSALPPAPEKKEISGSGSILITYADNTTGGNLSKQKVWGSNSAIKFTSDLTIRWLDGTDIKP
ncbi:MAG: hypothetical protein LBC88_08640 [Spirochaetaceae bacterium]|jgi:hypothetical protein|nr:hypothetical protein [Spirochaetaceae bacterium]